MSKAFWKSKTLWVNSLAILSLVLDPIGVELTPEVIAAILIVINFILRLITKEEIVWSK